MKLCKRAAALLLAALLMLLIPGCGASEITNGPEAGSYVCTLVESDGLHFSPETLFPAGVSLQLDSGGSGKLIVDGDEGILKWGVSDGKLHLNIAGIDYPAELSGDTVLLTLPDSGLRLTLLREGVEAPAVAGEDLSPWLGDWYGWWRVENAEGQLPDSWYDCFASVTEDDQGNLCLLLWDEETAKTKPLGSVVFRVEDGAALSTDGWFWYTDVAPEEWRLDNGGILSLSGRHEAEGESFDYTICLRPWGDRWEDAKAEDLPYYYEDWYLPLIDSEQPMPDEMDHPEI